MKSELSFDSHLLTAITCAEQAATNLHDVFRRLEFLLGHSDPLENEAFRIYAEAKALAMTLSKLGRSKSKHRHLNCKQKRKTKK